MGQLTLLKGASGGYGDCSWVGLHQSSLFVSWNWTNNVWDCVLEGLRRPGIAFVSWVDMWCCSCHLCVHVTSRVDVFCFTPNRGHLLYRCEYRNGPLMNIKAFFLQERYVVTLKRWRVTRAFFVHLKRKLTWIWARLKVCDEQMEDPTSIIGIGRISHLKNVYEYTGWAVLLFLNIIDKVSYELQIQILGQIILWETRNKGWLL